MKRWLESKGWRVKDERGGEMEAGPELNKLVAERVMDLKPDDFYAKLHWMTDGIPPYSTDIKAAWEVVEKISAEMRDRGDHAWFTIKNPSGWQATFDIDSNYRPDRFIRGESAPHAICLAALRAVGAVE